MTNKLIDIDVKIQQLKKKREQLQTQQALTFTREVQKIFKGEFTPEMALAVFANTWNAASDKQKKEWQMQAPHFRLSSRGHLQKAHSLESKSVEN